VNTLVMYGVKLSMVHQGLRTSSPTCAEIHSCSRKPWWIPTYYYSRLAADESQRLAACFTNASEGGMCRGTAEE
jgi:hypothetical protein